MTDSILISREAVMAEIAEMEAERARRDEIDRSIAGRERRLEAMRILAPEFFPAEKNATQVLLERTRDFFQEEAGKSKTLIDAVVRAVNGGKGVMSPKDIRQAIVDQGDGHLLSSVNYLYTAIKRSADAGRIDKQGDGYVGAL